VCNLYRLHKPADEVASFFGTILNDVRVIPGNAADEVYPGYPGLVLAEGQLRPMVWGFPLALKGTKGQPLKPKPVNNARTDKLSGPFWSASFRARRCLIPLSAYAEAEGPKGSMTRTWVSHPDQPLLVAAGLWRPTAEWGQSYAMVMTDASKALQELHARMPVILRPEQWPAYLADDPAAAFALCRTYDGALLLDRTDEPWAGRR
jgi:putative SOS response-associated peptidase YedK